MWNVLCVGLGGSAGAMCRYGISLLPVKVEFPLLTLMTNLVGAVLIGLVVGLADQGMVSPGWHLFWKTGVCGGFTTFSTFSLESWGLFQRGNHLLGGMYILLSVALCLAGVTLGQWISRQITRL
ncbi:MAG: fluoride efflux transporter CrcB [Lawsonibacter sp.]